MHQQSHDVKTGALSENLAEKSRVFDGCQDKVFECEPCLDLSTCKKWENLRESESCSSQVVSVNPTKYDAGLEDSGFEPLPFNKKMCVVAGDEPWFKFTDPWPSDNLFPEVETDTEDPNPAGCGYNVPAARTDLWLGVGAQVT